ncbi:unnamed protein product [Hymenolepis diminuta]|uniref:DUF7083 domain-containing protein n=1 Tax=Hymenolepis diminuta TaxID=6216 RepID=A0A564YSF5_HYMDI|nr:unnamed protein product [Hymenolepis diminuta]
MWYARNRDVYENRMAGLPEEMRMNMLLWKFSKRDHDLYLAYPLPLSPKDITFEETIEKWDRRFKSLNLAIYEGEDVHKYTAVVNRMCNAFSYASDTNSNNPNNSKPRCRFYDDFHISKDCPFYKH